MRVEGVDGDDRLESSPPTQAPSLTRRPVTPPPPPPPPRAEELRYGDTCTYFSICRDEEKKVRATRTYTASSRSLVAITGKNDIKEEKRPNKFRMIRREATRLSRTFTYSYSDRLSPNMLPSDLFLSTEPLLLPHITPKCLPTALNTLMSYG